MLGVAVLGFNNSSCSKTEFYAQIRSTANALWCPAEATRNDISESDLLVDGIEELSGDTRVAKTRGDEHDFGKYNCGVGVVTEVTEESPSGRLAHIIFQLKIGCSSGERPSKAAKL